MSYNLPASRDPYQTDREDAPHAWTRTDVLSRSFLRTFCGKPACEVRRKTAPHQSVQRYQLALLLHQEPHVPHEAAGQRVGLSGCQVRRWRKRWATGDFSVADATGRGARPFFPPLDHALVKAVACELVAETKQPLSRQSLADITAREPPSPGQTDQSQHRVADTGYRCPQAVAVQVLDLSARSPLRREGRADSGLYAGLWHGQPLGPRDHILSADEKTSIQARIRCQPALPPRRADRPISRTNTSAAVPCNIWPPGTCAGGT